VPKYCRPIAALLPAALAQIAPPLSRKLLCRLAALLSRRQRGDSANEGSIKSSFAAEPAGLSEPSAAAALPDIRLPTGLTLAGLAAGLGIGAVLAGTEAAEVATAVAGPIGALWLRGLQMTILPLVASLLVMGIGAAVAAARAGAMARRSLGLFAAILASGALLAALIMPLLLDLWPPPAAAATSLWTGGSASSVAPIPDAGEFLSGIVPNNFFAAAASDAVLPVVVFAALLGLAVTRLPAAPRAQLSGLFTALAGAMMVIVGWVLRLAPIGVFCLALGLGATSGAAAIGTLAHYIVLVSAIGLIVLLAAYPLAVWGGGLPLSRFARAMLPAQAVALSTQSSLASLPAMLASCRRLDIAPAASEFVLPLAVALFRATGPAMNLAVCIYVARLSGIEVTWPMLAAGVGMSLVTTLGTVSLPGSISFVSAIGPIALAMGLPLGPLMLLVAVEVLPDIVRTVGNVTMDVAVSATTDRRSGPSKG
jgi:proton glutamate symport protein